MITRIKELPDNMVGFLATDEVSAKDFIDVVMPEVEKFIEEKDKLNYMLVIETDLAKFSIGAWFQDALMGVKTITKWHRAAIVYDSQSIQNFTEVFSKIMIGEFKGFDKKDYDTAVKWTSEQIDL
ncbi:STAS/SEC14 domain-containing protein [Cloacibacterium normanense]|uniref:STAS/SEC14 domain-containing protein n=1 Tax=Cloacibacterium normanense TaxID=237258 RepID=A0A2S7I4H5_9FLAO|nr:STAS/SEC14 domain-containing protein [Cloacibacterium normanense]PPZ91486.1 STAS/SEC14 domain-containing protein [Cloacibacterium normanense]